jgi:hypothetical protein
VVHIEGILKINLYFTNLVIKKFIKYLEKNRLICCLPENFNIRSFGEKNHRRWLEPGASKGARQVPEGDLDSNVLI